MFRIAKEEFPSEEELLSYLQGKHPGKGERITLKVAVEMHTKAGWRKIETVEGKKLSKTQFSAKLDSLKAAIERERLLDARRGAK